MSPKGPDIDISTSSSTSFPSASDIAWWRDIIRSKTFQCYNSQSFRTLHIQCNKLLEIIKNKKYVKKDIDLNCHNIINVKNHLEDDKKVEEVVQQEEGGKRRRREGSGTSEDYITNMKNKKGENEDQDKDKDNGLLGKIFRLSITRLEEVNEAEMRQELNEEIKQISLRIVRSFHEYFTAIFYHALPASILYYPRQLVVGCDLNLFQSHLAAAREKNKNKDKSKDKDKDKCIVIDGVDDGGDNENENKNENENGKENENENGNGNEIGQSEIQKRSDSPIPFVRTSSADATVSTGGVVSDGGIGMIIGVGLKNKSNDSNMTSEKSPRNRGKMQVPFSSNTDEIKGSQEKDRDKDINRDKGIIKLKGKDKENEKDKEKERNGGRKKGGKGENDQIVDNQSDDCQHPSQVQSPRGYTPFAAAENVEEAFSQLVVDSPVFVDLLKRHGTILQYFRF